MGELILRKVPSFPLVIKGGNGKSLIYNFIDDLKMTFQIKPPFSLGVSNCHEMK